MYVASFDVPSSKVDRLNKRWSLRKGPVSSWPERPYSLHWTGASHADAKRCLVPRYQVTVSQVLVFDIPGVRPCRDVGNKSIAAYCNI